MHCGTCLRANVTVMIAFAIVLFGLIGFPLIEIAGFIVVGGRIGIMPTILATVATAIAGTLLLRAQGLSLAMRLKADLDAGRVPAEDLASGALMAVAAIFLLIPGFFTDACGLLLFVPPLRGALARILVARAGHIEMRIHRRREPERGPGRVVDLDADDWRQAGPEEADPRTPPHRPGSSPWRGHLPPPDR